MKTMHRSLYGLLIVVFAFGSLFAIPHTVNAGGSSQTVEEPVSEEVQRQVETMEQQQQRYEQAIQRMEQHLRTLPDGTFTIDVPNGASIGVDEATFNELLQGMQHTNAKIRGGLLKSSEVKTNSFSSTITTSRSEEIARAGCSGRSGVDTFWWGVRIYVNSCDTEAILLIVASGGGAAAGVCGILAAIPGVNSVGLPICAIAGVLVVAGAGVIEAIHVRGGRNGIQIDYRFVGPTTLWHQ